MKIPRHTPQPPRVSRPSPSCNAQYLARNSSYGLGDLIFGIYASNATQACCQKGQIERQLRARPHKSPDESANTRTQRKRRVLEGRGADRRARGKNYERTSHTVVLRLRPKAGDVQLAISDSPSIQRGPHIGLESKYVPDTENSSSGVKTVQALVLMQW
ncbi:uncharacterized protein B0H18DRAFT_956511 [Fomitopsis serialis]|uniref:uncharacterized protein n=1 Tax=Fomitopsis serialis TaxID=139415 RepID=UPI002008269A|nr:uncharacterized protein B0H18DRAFT_956511 [Neoantrodia serialis]KAH9921779.1 hypothetical protein B0H18DRAFT_956511 [Neoantrodia serialis]